MRKSGFDYGSFIGLLASCVIIFFSLFELFVSSWRLILPDLTRADIHNIFVDLFCLSDGLLLGGVFVAGVTSLCLFVVVLSRNGK